MKILIATDAWIPQVNGVIRSYQNILPYFSELGVTCDVIHPYLPAFKRRILKAYPEIEYVCNLSAVTNELSSRVDSDTNIHIATEGPIGLMTRRFCKRNTIPFTTGFHTLFPDLIKRRWGIPTHLTYPYFRWFHRNSQAILCPTVGLAQCLHQHGMYNTSIWTRGVDGKLFSLDKRDQTTGGYILCVSRASKEKGLDDFCRLNHSQKVLVGDGPYLASLKRKYPDVIFPGHQEGAALAKWYANADAFVFPSKSDTFGIVLLEAIASGTPVAAYPEPGPLEVIENGINGWINTDLQTALDQCANIDRRRVRYTAERWTWRYSARQFIEHAECVANEK
jgi:glycosyltransferase involved in cell wall biosynthesis